MSKRHSRGNPTPDAIFASVVALTKKLKHMSESPVVQLEAEFSNASFDFETARTSLLECARIIGSIQNAAPPIARLPPEILLIIFRLVQGPLKRLVPHPSKESRTCGWLVVTQVCRRWRLVAEAHPELWETCQLDLHDSSPDRSAEQIGFYCERSGMTKLRLGINGLSTGAQSKAVVKALSSSLDRVEELTVCANYMAPALETWVPVNDMMCNNSFPCLRALQLNRLGPRSPDLNRKFPSLESLQVADNIDHGSFYLHTVRQLHLSFQHYKSWDQLSKMCTALQKLPRLEDLWFTYCDILMDFMLDNGPVPVAAVRIPQLRKLAFNGCNEEAMVAITGCFDMKAQKELALVCTAQDEESPYVGLMQALFLAMPPPADDHGWKMYIEFHGNRSSITFASSSCALRIISRDFFRWEFNSILAMRLTEITASPPAAVKTLCLRILPEAGDQHVALTAHPMKTVVDLMFDLCDLPNSFEHHFQLPELSKKAINDYFNQKNPSSHTFHFYPSPGLLSSAKDQKMLERFSKLRKSARERGYKKIMFHSSGSPPPLQLPPVCTSPSKWCWTWPGWGPNAAFNVDGSDKVRKEKGYGIPW